MQFARRNRKTFPAGSSLSLSKALHDGAVIKLDTLAGSTVILPPALGTGFRCTIIETVLPTSNSHVVKVANATDFMVGVMLQMPDDAAPSNFAKAWPAVNSGTVATNSDTITLNRSTQGGTIVGEYVELEDVAPNVWHVRGVLAATGVEISPFSAGV